jgi:hypothetical protein
VSELQVRQAFSLMLAEPAAVAMAGRFSKRVHDRVAALFVAAHEPPAA